MAKNLSKVRPAKYIFRLFYLLQFFSSKIQHNKMMQRKKKYSIMLSLRLISFLNLTKFLHSAQSNFSGKSFKPDLTSSYERVYPFSIVVVERRVSKFTVRVFAIIIEFILHFLSYV